MLVTRTLLHWDSLAQWRLQRQRRVWLKVCT